MSLIGHEINTLRVAASLWADDIVAGQRLGRHIGWLRLRLLRCLWGRGGLVRTFVAGIQGKYGDEKYPKAFHIRLQQGAILPNP